MGAPSPSSARGGSRIPSVDPAQVPNEAHILASRADGKLVSIFAFEAVNLPPSITIRKKRPPISAIRAQNPYPSSSCGSQRTGCSTTSMHHSLSQLQTLARGFPRGIRIGGRPISASSRELHPTVTSGPRALGCQPILLARLARRACVVSCGSARRRGPDADSSCGCWDDGAAPVAPSAGGVLNASPGRISARSAPT